MEPTDEPRIKRIRTALGWSQSAMAEHLGVSQPTISNLENGQKESGPQKRLLDQLEAECARGERPAKTDEAE